MNKDIEDEKKRIIDCLSSLGKTEENVVTKLREENIKGTHSFGSCPIAQYVKKRANIQDEKISVSSAFITRYNNFENKYSIFFNEHEFNGIRNFIISFDNFFYPEFDQDLNGIYLK
jgi:hypothetical protein